MDPANLQKAIKAVKAEQSIRHVSKVHNINKGYLSPFMDGYHYYLKTRKSSFNARLTGKTSIHPVFFLVAGFMLTGIVFGIIIFMVKK